jgi:4-amino-4-deoxy-L-arabinose transferase-like glycosyltransferase
MKWKQWLPSSPFIIFLPFLFLYLLIVVRLPTNGMVGDETRYMMYAQNLLHGFYSPKGEVELWNGPGYPLFLMPFIVLKLPLICITLFNAVFQYLSIVFLYKIIVGYTNKSHALFFSLCWACYYIPFQELPNILTEPMTTFFMVLVMFLVQKYVHQSKSIYWGVLAGIFLGWLLLTKVIFVYVVLILLAGSIVYLIYVRLKKAPTVPVQKVTMVVSIAVLCLMPYWIYTYSLTHRIFYVGNSGGMSLYWMSTPYDNEFGDWNNENCSANCIQADFCNADLIAKNHRSELDSIKRLSGIARDDMYKAIAIKNIQAHPLKYVRNCISNFSRLLFGIPNTYYYQGEGTIIRIIPNAFILCIGLLTFVMYIFRFRQMPLALNFMLVLFILYMGFTILLSAYPRQFYIVVPIILTWVSVVFYRHIRISKKSFAT